MSSSTTTHFKWDVFLSHSSKDKKTVRDIAERLRDAGIDVRALKFDFFISRDFSFGMLLLMSSPGFELGTP